MADKTVDYAHVDECPHVDEDVDNLLGEQSTHVSGEQSTSKTLSQLEAHIAKMAETMSRMGDIWGRMATKRDCVDSSPPPFPPKRNRLDDDADSEAEMASLMRPLNPTESASSDEDEGGSCLTP